MMMKAISFSHSHWELPTCSLLTFENKFILCNPRIWKGIKHSKHHS